MYSIKFSDILFPGKTIFDCMDYDLKGDSLSIAQYCIMVGSTRDSKASDNRQRIDFAKCC